MAWLVSFILVLGILPSWTALSEAYQQAWPSLYRLSGPLNPLKLGAPILLLYCWQNRRAWPLRFWLWIGAFTGAYLLFSGISGYRCGLPPLFMREASVATVGLLGAIAAILLPKRAWFVVLAGWCLAIYGAAFLDQFFPASVDWLYAHIFDPQTRSADVIEVGRRVLTGVFGRQSLAKFLAWLPWLLWWGWVLRGRNGRGVRLAFLSFAILSTGMILMTSQRGPLVGALAGWIALGAHRGIRGGNSRQAGLAGIALILGVIATAVFVPQDVLIPRVTSTLGLEQSNTIGRIAQGNREFRQRITRFSLGVVMREPLGNACIPMQAFVDAGLADKHHSHNLMLEQFRARGWIWGLLHLALWLGAWTRTWLRRSEEAALGFAGLTAIIVSGMFDHPWFVLNQAMILCLFLLLGWSARREGLHSEPEL